MDTFLHLLNARFGLPNQNARPLHYVEVLPLGGIASRETSYPAGIANEDLFQVDV